MTISEVARLRHPDTIRRQSERMLALATQGRLERWDINLGRLPDLGRMVGELTRVRYPDLAVPMHGRRLHFRVGDVDLWENRPRPADRDEAARSDVGLIVVSVLLDAGSGPRWRYTDTEIQGELSRSEGLAVASFRAWERGVFSSRGLPRVDSEVLSGVGAASLAQAFQVREDNPLVGTEDRAALLRSLGRVSSRWPSRRVGGLFDLLSGHASSTGRLSAVTLLRTLLEQLSPLWPDSTMRDGQHLGDVWPYPPLGLMPFHKLTQWLAYSLIEPLHAAGITVTEVDRLTPLAEYRNGGLLIDGGVLTPVTPGWRTTSHPVSSSLVVEWRALTVALVGRLAELVREDLGARLSMAQILEGGTWAAGRRLAAAARPDARPPVNVASNGTIF
ncbi:MAG: DUF1688 family protein [bacterium]|nr:DUF1688 family protein [bacterium]